MSGTEQNTSAGPCPTAQQEAVIDELDGFMDDAAVVSSATAANAGATPTGSGLNAAASLLQSSANSASPWDPLDSRDWDMVPISQQCLMRIRRDIMSIYQEPPHGIFVVLDEEKMTVIHALVIGPYDTPYEGGFFYFVLRCPPDYPIRPPRVRLMTTDDNAVRFNPNLYRNGKVCLSILGTWSGPSWSPAQSIASVLLSIQSLMNENPYHNEPGYEKEHRAGDSTRYSQIIRHEALRVAVCDMLEGRGTAASQCPEALKEAMRESFAQFYASYVSSCEKLQALTGTQMTDPFHDKRGKFDFDCVLKRLQRLKQNLCVVDAESISDADAHSEESEAEVSTPNTTHKDISSSRSLEKAKALEESMQMEMDSVDLQPKS